MRTRPRCRKGGTAYRPWATSCRVPAGLCTNGRSLPQRKAVPASISPPFVPFGVHRPTFVERKTDSPASLLIIVNTLGTLWDVLHVLELRHPLVGRRI